MRPGHRWAAFAVAVGLLATAPLAGAGCLVLAAGIGASRVYLGAHYPLDVLAALALGVTAGLAVTGLMLA